ncbi:DUF6086 family protein [Streptomyces sp. N50]|uniref:DUF6086 family protein n=1 Tax=Streptomyces sp. N50 TaxID=3081765 RepID=UPI0029622338|nr:DUF6086 family protein [Streptomyces sp. N50]WOX17170.1 DUF6086 family protein [Streptomyces sp. N50]
MYFDAGDETLWNPSNGAGRLFLRQLELFEAELKLPSGIGQGKHWGDRTHSRSNQPPSPNSHTP